MPFFLQRPLPALNGEIGLWKIEESESWFLSRIALHPDEQSQLDQIKGHRRIEWLSARYLVHKMSGRSKRGIFLKDQFGKPHLQDSPWQISISHSRHLSAAIAAPHAVGIDIQKLVPKIERIVPRFMRPEEQASLGDQFKLEHIHVYWGAKEALYKAYGRKQLDFRKHIQVEPFIMEPAEGRCNGRITKDDYQQNFSLYYEILPEDYILVYCHEKSRST